MDLVVGKSFFLILAAALGYAVATIGMKLASSSFSAGAVALLVAGFAAAALAEIVIMRSMSLGMLYLCVIAVETLVVLGYAQVIGEGLSPLQWLGGALVLAGLVVVSA